MTTKTKTTKKTTRAIISPSASRRVKARRGVLAEVQPPFVAQCNTDPATTNETTDQLLLDTQCPSVGVSQPNEASGQKGNDNHVSAAAASERPENEGHLADEAQTRTAPSRLDFICSQLMEHSRVRRFWMRQRIATTNNLYGFARMLLGSNISLPEAERKRLATEARRIVDAVMSGEDHSDVDIRSDNVLPTIRAAVENSRPGLESCEKQEKVTTKAIGELAKQLPVFDWWNKFDGLGANGLGLIIAETGNLHNYANPAKVWARMRLHVDGGKAVKGGHRRSVMFVVMDSALRKQSTAESGPLGALFAKYYADVVAKAAEKGITVCAAAKIPKGQEATHMNLLHVRRRAFRRVEKELLVWLWKEWKHGNAH